uniref:Uncharacterized protein n=1 Tax=Arundo donax TaxID=35708 RepID=A0A0A9CLA5_ARUDO
MEVDLDQGPRGDPLIGHLLAQVEAHQLFVARVEPETRWQRRIHLPQPHPNPMLCKLLSPLQIKPTNSSPR